MGVQKFQIINNTEKYEALSWLADNVHPPDFPLCHAFVIMSRVV